MPRHYGHLSADPRLLKEGTVGKFLPRTSLSTWGETPRGWTTIYDTEAYPQGVFTGESNAHNNMPPYLTVNIWKRVK